MGPSGHRVQNPKVRDPTFSREARAPQGVGRVSSYLGDRRISALRGGEIGFRWPLFSLHQSPESFAGLVKLRF